ncbi:hypothetical protein K437DRAFT_137795 [Tilletiaria anomala UBC 951]|uniref:BHLH domain-containing protein n=1 Tax=Tilletiaria anomala (strain ATCC 24038 / CBS 436.72 / UBC 951) TaxID=1037660 RepID=A0A066W153_TILAU|nr:uncharacterized protein K437DRAFT_137795 [Tilletiaria anomala UBC 951]KDN44520.1 hypothetical protein K437DRAFT_137795 [Tilletiaria anomala UBC 951]
MQSGSVSFDQAAVFNSLTKGRIARQNVLFPTQAIEEQAVALAPVPPESAALAALQAKPNKGIILSKTVEYISRLQELSRKQILRNRDLESEVKQLREKHKPLRPSISNTVDAPDPNMFGYHLEGGVNLRLS